MPDYLLVILACLLALAGCKPATESEKIRLSAHQHVFLLDSLQAAGAISQDGKEGYFEKVQPLDMAIQMKQPLAEGKTREAMLEDYRAFLRADVAGFSPEEEALLRQVFQQAFRLCRGFSSALFPDTIRLIKTRMRHYGPGVYYTRERCIIIPANELQADNAEALTGVMLHELFHIYSRYHPEQREALYRLIGFERLARPLHLPDSLQQRLLLNPDGIDYRYGIAFDGPGGRAIQAVGLISAAFPEYSPSHAQYFEYLDFQLYPITRSDSAYAVQVINASQSPLPPVDSLPGFFRRIGDNTSYIIHPDEILAENFVFMIMMAAGDPNVEAEQYSARGRELLSGMERILR
ncbi:MAG: hypothetical protein H6564_07925 [Lewinellaceae bacterium]|nr:hypothetical protein [Lewinellaceae bacterium]